MLRIQSSVVMVGEAQVETDFYVPLDVIMTNSGAGVPRYWRTGDFKRSLLEVGLETGSGRFLSVTVTQSPKGASRKVAAAPASQPQQPGIPVFELGTLKEDFTDEKGPFLLHVGADFVWLDLAPGQAHLHELRYDRLRFLLGPENVWLGLVVEGLTELQLSELWEGTQRVEEAAS